MYQTITLNSNLSSLASDINKKRIIKHLNSIVKKLESRDITNFTAELQENRHKTINYLKEYIELEEFPVNNKTFRRHAIFKDEFGNYCAVGYLLYRHGKDNLVDEIVESNNLVYINEIKDQKYLDAITEMGISKDEAAMIQPGYGYDPFYPTNPTVSDDQLLISSIAITFYVLFQLTALLLVKRIDKPRSTKVLMYLTMFFGSSLVGVGIYAVIQLL